VRAVGEPVESGRGEERFAEQIRPLGAITIAGEQDRGLLIPLVDDVIQVLGTRRAQGLEAEVIEDEQIGARVAKQALVMRAVGPPTGQVGVNSTSKPRRQASWASAWPRWLLPTPV
jgi:hypothetical protein